MDEATAISSRISSAYAVQHAAVQAANLEAAASLRAATTNAAAATTSASGGPDTGAARTAGSAPGVSTPTDARSLGEAGSPPETSPASLAGLLALVPPLTLYSDKGQAVTDAVNAVAGGNFSGLA